MGQRAGMNSSAPKAGMNVSEIADEVIKKLRSDQAATRRREAR